MHPDRPAPPTESAASTGVRQPAPAEGRVALVTGGARRIGAAIAQHLHGHGMRVAIHHHTSAGDAQALAAELNAVRPGSALPVTADLLDPAAPERLVAQVTGAFGRLDLLVNNASTFYPTPVGSITEQAWNDLVGTNLKAPLFLIQAAAPALRAAGGAVINLADIHAERPLAGHPVYCTAKAGLLMLTRALARELGPEVRVNAVSPGPILWPVADGADEQARAKIVESTALKRTGDPGDIAAAVLFLAEHATYITGQVLAVDGGRSIG